MLLSCSFQNRLSRHSVGTDAPIDVKLFNQRLRLAEELVLDDKIAWLSTDSIIAEKPSRLDSLDQTWFVFEEDGLRYAYYGRYAVAIDTYLVKYAFVATDSDTITRAPLQPGTTAMLYAKAVTLGAACFKTIVDSLQLDIHYNHYIRKTGTGWYTMWFFPAGYGNYAAQGIEVSIVIDLAAGKVTGHQVTGTLLRYFELDKKDQPVDLDNTYEATPSLGNIFFLLCNRDKFPVIRIVNKNSVSTMRFSPETGTWSWVHTAQ